MKKVCKIIVVIISVILIWCCKSTGEDTDPLLSSKPNIVFILADDFGLYDLSFMGSDFYETPNIDKIAKNAVIFENGYSASRVCSPSRASIMTGQFTARHQITDWIGARSGEEWRKANRNDILLPADYNHVLPADLITMPEALQAAGYETFFTGKWHIGDVGSHPEDHGFQINKGGWEVGSPRGGYFSPWENPSLPNEEDGENLSMRLAKETVKFIRKERETPFLAYLSFYAVHGPIQTTEEKWRKYRDKAEANGIADHGFEMERVLPIRVTQDNPVYAGLVEQMDDAVGLVLDELESRGLMDQTIIVFTSDNGGVASGDAYSTSNQPLRGGKGYQWEGGIREPFFIQIPGVEHQNVEYPASGIDFYPTLLDYAGIDLPEDQIIDGVSLKPVIEGKSLGERPLYWHYPHYGNQGGEPSSIIREGKWKLIHYYENDHIELYDLEADLSEENDLSKSNPSKAKALKNQLSEWLKAVSANMPRKDEQHDPALAKKMYQEKINVLMPRLEAQRIEFLSKDFDPQNHWWGSQTKD
ncbi:sulfatase [Portibacter marinus]|uniref:sulfatase n=1 Tax=Portibacter marinus TaxID=2898660 RepID=UPI001F3FBAAB|nr:sulfatase [Portibacter marinus]